MRRSTQTLFAVLFLCALSGTAGAQAAGKPLSITPWVFDPGAIQVPPELQARPDVQAQIKEYIAIAKSRPDTCGQKKSFGLRAVKIDGVPWVRYYVDMKTADCIPSRMRPDAKWQIRKLEWDQKDEAEFGRWVQSIGHARAAGKCSTTDSCLLSSANYLKQPIDEKAYHYSDCADFPFYLRSYFAFRKGLPFSYSTVIPRPITEKQQARYAKEDLMIQNLKQTRDSGTELTVEQTATLKSLEKGVTTRSDVRYSINGNMAINRKWVVESGKTSYYRFAQQMRDSVSTATYRMSANLGAQKTLDNGNVVLEQEPDFYSAAITGEGIHPGTVIYQTDGHAGLVYEVDALTFKPLYMDAHPDNSITFGPMDMNWATGMNGSAVYGGGFKNFRPVLIRKHAQPDERLLYDEPSYSSWEIRAVTDAELGATYSTEQYTLYAPDRAKLVPQQFGARNLQLNFLDFTRMRISQGTYYYDPVPEFQSDLREICTLMQARRVNVEAATDKGIHLLEHPATLPTNIFGASGLWEDFSTPSRDIAAKQKVILLGQGLAQVKARILKNDPLLKPGTTVSSFKADAFASLNQIGNACLISYKRSTGQEMTFNFLDGLTRLPRYSYDPFDCPEHRYGAIATDELSTCATTPSGHEWYKQQQFLRNRTEKNSVEAMGWSLDELIQKNGSAADPALVKKLDLKNLLESL